MLFFSFLRRAAVSEWPSELPVIPQTPPPLLPPPHLLTSLRFHLGQRAGLHTSPLPSPVTLQQETKEGRKGDIPTRSSSSPRDFTLGYVCMLSPPRRVFYVRPSILRASFLPSSLRFALRGFSSNQLCGEGAWRLTRSRAVQPSLTDLLHRVLGHRGELLRCEVAGGEFRGAEVESDGCHPTGSDYSRVIDFI